MYPPQAFTREMLSQAFIWLQAQPESIRSLASNPESLIALYLKAQRSQLMNQNKMESQNSKPQAEAPAETHTFMTDLKSLTHGLKKFDEPWNSASTAAQVQTPVPPPAPQNSYSIQAHISPAPPQNFSASHQISGQISGQMAGQLPPPMPTLMPISLQQLNANSQYMIQEVKVKFNLSSELEAINLLVAIAYKNLKSLIE